MKPEFIEFIGNARQRKSDNFRNQLIIFLICLIISVFLWSLVRLSRNYYYTLTYHLNYTHIPYNYRIVQCSDSLLTIRIQIPGYDFFSENFLFHRTRKAEVSLRNIRVKSHESRLYGIMLTEPIARDIASEDNFPTELFSVRPDTLFFEFERRFPKLR